MDDDPKGLQQLREAMAAAQRNLAAMPKLLDWPQLVMRLQDDLRQYLDWLNDFRDGANAEQLAAIKLHGDAAQALLMIIDAEVKLQDGHELLNMPTRGSA